MRVTGFEVEMAIVAALVFGGTAVSLFRAWRKAGAR
jgi:hypothetical protein